MEEFKETSQMKIEEFTHSLIAHESNIWRYDDSMLENAKLDFNLIEEDATE